MPTYRESYRFGKSKSETSVIGHPRSPSARDRGHPQLNNHEIVTTRRVIKIDHSS